MAISKLGHVGIVVNDMETAIELFVQLGLEPEGRGNVAADGTAA